MAALDGEGSCLAPGSVTAGLLLFGLRKRGLRVRGRLELVHSEGLT